VDLKYAINTLAAGAPLQIPLRELTTLPDPLVGWGGDTPSPLPTPLGAFGA